MVTFLFVFKILGVLISGVTALVALFRSKVFEEARIPSPIIGGSERIERRLTTEGKLSVLLVIVGLVVTLVAQSIEQSGAVRRGVELQQQSVVMLTILDQIQHIVGQFQEIETVTVFELPAWTNSLTELIDETVRSNVFRITDAARPPGQSTIDQRLENYGLAVASYINLPDGSIYSITLEKTLHGFNLSVPVTMQALEKLVKSAGGSKNETEKVLQFFRSPMTTLSVWNADSRRTIDKPDFLGIGMTSDSPSIEYLFPSDRLRISWTSKYPKSNWVHNVMMTALPDLGGAMVKLTLDNYPKRLDVEQKDTDKAESFGIRISEPSPAILRVVVNGITIGCNIGSAHTNGVAGVLPRKEDFMPKSLGNLNAPAPRIQAPSSPKIQLSK
jgi:hypothetical protein